MAIVTATSCHTNVRFPERADPYSPRMSKRNSGSWLSHRNLLTAETAMLVAVAMQFLQNWVAERPDVPWWLKTLMVMLVNGGLLGGLLLLLNALTRSSLAGAHKVVQAVPLPTPFLAIHIVILGGMFILYAHMWAYWPH
ncbi:MAG: hypothetical protein AAB263_02320 [Planctomycetota bacterium]